MSDSQNKSKKKTSKFLMEMKKFLFIVPQIEAPPTNERETIDLQDKLLWTLGCLVIYLILCGTPLYGVRLQTLSQNADPLYWFRPMLASRSGSLMELGISPIVTSGLVLQLLAGSRMINYYGNDKEYKALYQAVQKLLAILISVGSAFAFIASGVYGHWWYDLGVIGCILIFIQLFCGSLILILLDEVIQRGYGLGNGVSLFIATNICTNIVWKTLSPTTIDTASGIQYEGAIIALFHLLLTRKSIVPALKEAFYRSNLPNITNLFSTILMFIVVIYFQGFRIDLPVKSTKLRGTQGQTKYPIKLFYTSNIPIILHTALVSNICFLSQVLTIRFGSNVVTNLFGKWSVASDIASINHDYNMGNMDYNSNKAIGGLVYYMSAPHTIYELISDPIHSVIYLTFVLSTCALFSYTWINVSGSSPKDVAKQLKDQGLVIRGYKEHATYQVLQRYIPTAALFGGVTIAALTILADCIGCIGSGASVLLAVTIIFEIFETYVREAQAQGFQMPGMGLQ
eukprot:438509_1